MFNKKINPLNVHNLRQLHHCPPHFTRLTINQTPTTLRDLSNWIYENLEGRFYIEGEFDKIIVAFERPEESTYFGLMAPSI